MRIFYILQNVQNFQSQWLNIEKFKKDHHLRDTVNFLPHIVKNAKSRSTNKKYDSYFSKFRDWCLKHSFVHLPASESTVALFLGGLVQQRVSTFQLLQHKLDSRIFFKFEPMRGQVFKTSA